MHTEVNMFGNILHIKNSDILNIYIYYDDSWGFEAADATAAVGSARPNTKKHLRFYAEVLGEIHFFCCLHQISMTMPWGRSLVASTWVRTGNPQMDTSFPFFMSRRARRMT